jgi:glycosidase
MFRAWLATLVLALVSSQSIAAPVIERVEPRSWWVGMKDERLQLLVHGPSVAGLEPSLRHPGVTLEGVERVANANYLFVNLRISSQAPPGEMQIEFRRAGRKVASHAYPLLARAPGSADRRGFGPGDVIYLVMPDRFANGDPANDAVRGMGDVVDRSQPLARHGGDLRGIIDRLDYIAGMGFTQLWLNPALENNQPEASYHGYAITDFYRVDPRLGTNESFRQLADEARSRGIGLIMDVVLNHSGSNHWWRHDPPTDDWFNEAGKSIPATHMKEVLQDIHAADADRRAFTDAWFVPTMPDLNQRNRLLATYLIQNSIWWVEYAGLSGLRVDTYPYSDRGFLSEWSRRLTEEYPRLGIVGEVWSSAPQVVAHWQRGGKPQDGSVSYLPGLFDFPLQEAMIKGLNEPEGSGTGLRRIYHALTADGLYADPDQLVVFHDNHDISRTLTALGDRQDLNRMALAFVLTTRGIPQIFYGTEVLMRNPGTEDHGAIRSDFPGGWPGDSTDAVSGRGLAPDAAALQRDLRQLLQWRRNSPAIREGRLTQYVPSDGTYVYFRQHPQQTVMVILNKNETAHTLDLARFSESIGAATRGVDVLSGEVRPLAQSLQVAPRSATILELH